jgi:hypothetical protein
MFGSGWCFTEEEANMTTEMKPVPRATFLPWKKTIYEHRLQILV